MNNSKRGSVGKNNNNTFEVFYQLLLLFETITQHNKLNEWMNEIKKMKMQQLNYHYHLNIIMTTIFPL